MRPEKGPDPTGDATLSVTSTLAILSYQIFKSSWGCLKHPDLVPLPKKLLRHFLLFRKTQGKKPIMETPKMTQQFLVAKKISAYTSCVSQCRVRACAARSFLLDQKAGSDTYYILYCMFKYAMNIFSRVIFWID
jgi:hypothetical protein